MRQFFASMTRDPVSLLGAAITTASALLIISLFVIELFGFLGNPYIGILAYMILPAFFALGLLLIPIGVRRARKRARRAKDRGEVPTEFAVIDLNLPRVRHWVIIFLGLSMVNLVILATATYKGVEVMETTEFCGETCHSVMAPEFTAYQRSPHARVSCVDCHIGPGADWFVKSKLSGAWQVVAVTLDLYPRPIPTPIHDLRPARETCEQCHWPTKFVGDRLKVLHHTDDDEGNTPLSTLLLMRVGGPEGGASRGIHWHIDPEINIRYRSDASRETIYEVELTRPDGTQSNYYSDGDADGAPSEGTWRQMDCVDCHNRPTHVLSPPRAGGGTPRSNRRYFPVTCRSSGERRCVS